MIHFAWPMVFFILPLPLVFYKLFPKRKENETLALCVPDLGDFKVFPSQKKTNGKLALLMGCLMWVMLVTAAARPQWIGQPIEIPQSGRDLMLAVDLSGSMMFEDFEINGRVVDRLSALKIIVSDFIERRRGDRLGLILFGSQAYLQAPLTFDTVTVKKLLLEAVVGLAGKETAIGDAVGLAVKQMKESDTRSRVLILLTDGNNNTGELSPEKAAELAANFGLKVHTVAIGSNEYISRSIFGTRRIHPSAEIDEKALQMVAEKTGGNYYRAYNTKELVKIYQEIDRLEAIEQETKYFRPTDEKYFIPLITAVVCMGLMLVRRWW